LLVEGLYTVTRYDKLVRDRIPQIIEAEGKRCTVRVLDDEQYARSLDSKLIEELVEYQQNRDIEELADLVEVIHAIVIDRGMSLDAFAQLRQRKAEARGGVGARRFLESVE
jgi:predicted house-cleaning noncanonical NTP pyrophosphatase (MazG superfamily)